MKAVAPVYRFILAALLLLVLFVGSSFAQQKNEVESGQTYSFIFKGEPLKYALQKLVETTELNLIYDPAIMPDYKVFATAKNKPPEDVLRILLQGSGLDFIQLSSGTYVLTSAPQKASLYGNLSGRIIDKLTEEPIAGANVMLTHTGGGASTNGNGYFSIPRLKRGFHEITITYVGYKPEKDTVWVPANKTGSFNFSLTSEPVLVEPIIVKGIQPRVPAAQAFNSTLDASQITKQQTPGYADAVKSLNALTGIDFSLPLADFNIQGGGEGEHQLRLDGVPIYNPVSLGRLEGAFSPWAIKKIIVHKAGFGAPVGSQLSGVIDMVQDVGNATDNTMLVQVNPMNINGRFDHQFKTGNGPSIKLMLAARLSSWPFYKEPTLKNTLRNWDHIDPVLTLNLFNSDSSDTYFQTRDHSYDIRYSDLHAAAELKHNAFHQTRISAYIGRNLLQTDLYSENVVIASAPEPSLFYSIDHYDWMNYMAKIKHLWVVNPRLDATLSGYLTHHSFDHSYIFTNNRDAGLAAAPSDYVAGALKQYAIQSINTGDNNALTQSSVRFTLKYSAARNYSLRGGLRATHLNYKFSLSDLYYNAAKSNSSNFLISGYVQNNFLLSNKTSFSVGTRMTFVPSRDLVFAEPRIALKYDEPSASIGYLSAKISGGIYRQFINQFDVSNVGPSTLVPSLRFWAPVDYTTTVPKAYHLAVESLWEPSNSWEIRLGTYYKWIPTRLALNYQLLSSFPSFIETSYTKQQQFITPATGYAYGANLSLKKKVQPLNMTLKGSYQYSMARQRISSRFQGSYQPLPTSQPHKVDASVNWLMAPNWTLLLHWQSIWGRSWGFRKAYYDYLSFRGDENYGTYSFDDPGEDRLPRYSQLNVGLSYRLNIGRPNLQFRIDVLNILNHKNVLNYWLFPYRDENSSVSYHVQERTLSGLRPSLSIKLSY